MELWIRSQDKDIILKVKSIIIDDNNNDIYTQDYIGENLVTYTLGRYETKERALEVLDEIHQRLIDIQCLEIIKETTDGMKKRGVDCVYTMPQE